MSRIDPRAANAAEASEDGRPTLSRRLGKAAGSVRAPVQSHRSVLPPHLLVVDTLGEGGTATVYEAFHQRLKVKVAVKVPKASSIGTAELHQRLVREAELCARLGSSRVPHIYDVDTLRDGTPYVVMDLIRGRCLEDLLAEGPLEVDTACAIISDLLTAISDLHAAGIVHRDIKPSNLMLEDTADGVLRVRVLDLGIAACLPGTGADKRLTQSGMFVGTPGYMAHEQLLGKEVDQRADIYAIGAVFYEMLAGEAAFAGESASQVIAAALRDEPKRLAHVPQALMQIVARAMSKSASDRFASTEDMKLAIQRFQQRALSLSLQLEDQEGATSKALHSFPPYPTERRRSSRALSWLAAAAAAGTIAMTWPSRPASDSTLPAVQPNTEPRVTEKPLTEPPRLLLLTPSLMEHQPLVIQQEHGAKQSPARPARARPRAERREAMTRKSSDAAGFIPVNPYTGAEPSTSNEAPLPPNPYSRY